MFGNNNFHLGRAVPGNASSSFLFLPSLRLPSFLPSINTESLLCPVSGRREHSGEQKLAWSCPEEGHCLNNHTVTVTSQMQQVLLQGTSWGCGAGERPTCSLLTQGARCTAWKLAAAARLSVNHQSARPLLKLSWGEGPALQSNDCS